MQNIKKNGDCFRVLSFYKLQIKYDDTPEQRFFFVF